MPIQSINEEQRMPVLGKIRLGIRQESSKGSMYPKDMEYFILKDAPEVEKVYGPEPKEIDVIFLSDNLDEIIPTWFKWYSGGAMDKEGNFVGGKIQCRGNGPGKDAEGRVVPGIAEHWMKKDPVTRVVPTRPCLGDQCPDWKNARGDQQCKQSMNVLAMLPRVSPYGVFRIDTTSWNSIRSFWDQLRFIKKINNGVIRGVPFKIARELNDNIRYHDKRDGKEKRSEHHIMVLKHNADFLERHGEQMRQLVQKAFGTVYSLPDADKIALQPMEDHTPVGQIEDQSAPVVDPIETFYKTEGVSDLLDQLAALKGKKVSEKDKKGNIKTWIFNNKEASPDDFKLFLQSQIDASQPKAAVPAAVEDGGIV